MDALERVVCSCKLADGLAFDLFAVNVERHGHRAEIFGLGKGIERARLALVTVPVAVDSLAVATRIRAISPTLPLVVRTDTLEEIEPLLRLQALNVVQPEFEGALEMAREALNALGIEHSEARRTLDDERARRFGTQPAPPRDVPGAP